MSWNHIATRFGRWNPWLARRRSSLPDAVPPADPRTHRETSPAEAERQNRSFDQWCTQGRGRDGNQEL